MSLSQTKRILPQLVPRHLLGAEVGQGGFPAGGLGTALPRWGDKSLSLWGWLGTPMGLRGGKHSLACLIDLCSCRLGVSALHSF